MANLMQMLAASQAKINPYQQAQEAGRGAAEAESSVGLAKREQQKELEELAQQMADEASGAGGFFKGLGGLGSLLSLIPGVGPIAGATLKGLGDIGFASEQKKAYGDLSKDARLRKYEGTYLSRPVSEIKGQFGEYAEAFDPLASGISGITQALTLGELGDKFKGLGGESTTGNLGSSLGIKPNLNIGKNLGFENLDMFKEPFEENIFPNLGKNLTFKSSGSWRG